MFLRCRRSPPKHADRCHIARVFAGKFIIVYWRLPTPHSMSHFRSERAARRHSDATLDRHPKSFRKDADTMAKRVIHELIDDMNGQPADESVTFGLDGVQYEIDLTTKNAAKLRSALAPFVAAATK